MRHFISLSRVIAALSFHLCDALALVMVIIALIHPLVCNRALIAL